MGGLQNQTAEDRPIKYSRAAAEIGAAVADEIPLGKSGLPINIIATNPDERAEVFRPIRLMLIEDSKIVDLILSGTSCREERRTVVNSSTVTRMSFNLITPERSAGTD